MAISVVKTSTFEVRESRKKIVRETAALLAKGQDTLEEGMSDLIVSDNVAKLATVWRAVVRKCDGNVDAIAGELFTPQQRESLRESADAIFRDKGGDGNPQMGDHAAVKIMERLLFSMAFKTRNKKNPHLGENDPYASHRMVETLRSGLPQLKSPKMAATADTIGWFEKLIAELGG